MILDKNVMRLYQRFLGNTQLKVAIRVSFAHSLAFVALLRRLQNDCQR